MKRFRVNTCLVIIIIVLLLVGLAVYRLITKAIPWWRSIMKPRVITDEMNPVVSIGGDRFASQPKSGGETDKLRLCGDNKNAGRFQASYKPRA